MPSFQASSLEHARCKIQMPFYLVTHTALVEAEDEVGAAEKVMANLQTEPRMTFTVKLDENSIKHVSVTRRPSVADGMSTVQPAIESGAVMPRDIAGSKPVQEDQPVAESVTKPNRSAGKIGAIFLALCFAACVLAGLFHFVF